ncbi:MAG TPA: MFS transporter [Victivallales bacterium]|nr:MFS transporter [Victivallales bacterium]
MENVKLNKFKIILTFVSMGILTSGMATYVMQAVNFFHISYASAGALESYQNITTIIVSFFMFSILIKTGFKRSIKRNFLCFMIICAILPFLHSIWGIRIYLVAVGISMLTVKIVAYSSVGLVTKTKKEHASFINLMEGIYTFFSLAGMWIFAYFLKHYPEHWMMVFWVFGAICLILLLFWTFTPFDESKIEEEESKPIKDQFKEILKIMGPVFIMFLLIFASYESLEQGVGSWLANFDHQVLGIPTYLAVQLASMLTLGIAFGRIIGAFIVKRIKWYKMFLFNFIVGIIILYLVMTHIVHDIGAGSTSIFNSPIIAFGIPIIGILIGPTYPTIVSALLTSIPKAKHAAMISMVIICGAIFDSASSRIIGVLFGHIGGVEAFTIAIAVPLIIVLLLITPYYLVITKKAKDNTVDV